MKKTSVFYLTHFERVHDHQFLSHLVSRDDVALTCILLHPEIPSEISQIKGLSIVHLYNKGHAIDDPYRGNYTWKARFKLRLARRYYAKKLKDLIKLHKPDVIHSVWTQIDTAIATKTGFHPILMMPVGTDILINPFKNSASRRDTKKIIENVDYITCDARSVQEKALEICPSFPKEHFLVFPWGVDVDLFKPTQNPAFSETPRLIMTRNFHAVYNHRFFIDMLAVIQKTFPKILVTLVGDGPLKSDIEQQVKKLHLQENVTFSGYLTKPELIAHMQASHLYVSTSISDGTSVSLLEAMSCGIPCAVSDLAANKEWITQDNGIIFNLSQLDACAQQVISLLQDPKRLRDFSQKNRQIALTKANWHKHMNHLVELYQSLARAAKK